MRVAATELAARNVRVNAISPGPVTTEGFYDLAGGEANARDLIDQIANQIPLGRLGTPDEAIPLDNEIPKP